MAKDIELIIKAPNQNIDDYLVHCTLEWTVQKLKNHLSDAYPTKPLVQDQKLIYSGRLLHDDLQLKDFLRHEEGQLNVHTLHLVCGTKNSNVAQDQEPGTSHYKPNNPIPPQPDMMFNNMPGPVSENLLRHRNNLQVPSTSAIHPQLYTGGNQSIPNFPTVPMDPQVVTQMAAMQQMYAYYFTQYMQSFSSAVNNPTAANFPPATLQPLQNPNIPPNENQVQRPANPNMRMNANGRIIDENDEFGNRDFLDHIFLCCRFFIFFSIIYFYSSPERLMLVIVLALFAFLYHEGWFARRRNLNQTQVNNNQTQRRTSRNGDENPNQENNSNDSSQDNQAAPSNETENQEEHEIEAAMDGDDPPHAQNHDAPNNNIFSALTLISAFFSSLIPEPPPPVNIN